MPFAKGTIPFILKVARQKKPDWLERNREDYEALVLNPLKELAGELRRTAGESAPGYHFPQKGIGRLKRSAPSRENSGSIYKGWVSYSASRPSGSRFDHNPSLFFMINPDDSEGDEVLLAGGLYMPSSRQLRAIREAIARNAAPFEELFSSKLFNARFSGGFCLERISKRVPRGFDPQHERIGWLKLQGYFVWRSYKLKQFTSRGFARLVAADALQLLRLNELLDQAISGRWRGLPEECAVQVEGLSTRLGEMDSPRRRMDF